MTDTAALVAQIRALLGFQNETPRIPNLARQLLTEAADRLESLSAPAPDGEVEVERVARAIYEASIPKGGKNYAAWDDLDSLGYETNREDCERSARAAIAALPRRDGMERMREALEPFAREVGRFGRGNEKRAVKLTMEDRDGHPAIDLLVSDFEAARAALKGEA